MFSNKDFFTGALCSDFEPFEPLSAYTRVAILAKVMTMLVPSRSCSSGTNVPTQYC